MKKLFASLAISAFYGNISTGDAAKNSSNSLPQLSDR